MHTTRRIRGLKSELTAKLRQETGIFQREGQKRGFSDQFCLNAYENIFDRKTGHMEDRNMTIYNLDLSYLACKLPIEKVKKW